ncbi:MAG: hypothetical protein QNI87_02015 [Erythrobacter sp.]|uniref:hypothetical protein n=1 Tax=Erythrobacter sp. TaxID=1042 RepID=UPI0026283088|nr:hypothetical protein [Erythrobacter sp.]MDJ0977291.1 hypothetical protein [Erythrobacter sp.]
MGTKLHIRTCLKRASLTLLLAGLWLNALAPAGYMITSSQSAWLVVVPCPEMHPLARALKAPTKSQMTMKGKSTEHAHISHAHMDHPGLEHGHDEGPSSKKCDFAGLTKFATGAANPIVFALAIAFALLLAFAPRGPLQLPRLVKLRPPLRGPPAYA